MATRTARGWICVQVVAALIALADSTIVATASGAVTPSVAHDDDISATGTLQLGTATQSTAAQNTTVASEPQHSAPSTKSNVEGTWTVSPLPESLAMVQSTVTANWTSEAIRPTTTATLRPASSSAFLSSPDDPMAETMDRELNSTMQTMDSELSEAMNPTEATSHDYKFVKKIQTLVQQGLKTCKELNNSKLDYQRRTKSLVLGIKNVDCTKPSSQNSFPDRSNQVAAKAVEDIADTITAALPCPIIIFNVTDTYRPAARRRREVQSDSAAGLEAEPDHPFRRRCRRSQETPASDGNRFKARIRIVNATFNNSLLNKTTREYENLKTDLQTQLKGLPHEIQTVEDLFTFSDGSVIADFYVDAPQRKSVNAVRWALGNATDGGILGNVQVMNVTHVTVVDGNYTAWNKWGACDASTFMRKRRRTCANPAPDHGGRGCDGPATEDSACNCSGLFENGGNITSPRYPNNYPNEVSCKWVLKAPINNTVLLALESFELEKDKKCLYDHVQIYDGDTTDATPLSGNLCGQQLKKKFRSSSRTMLVVFKSDESETRKGFKASWTAELYKETTKPQSVTVISALYTPKINGAFVPLGRATTCPTHSQKKECVFDKPVYVISRLSAVTLSRNLNFTNEDKVSLTLSHIMHEDLFPKMYTGKKYCVMWDPNARSIGAGGWTRSGCSVATSNLTHTSCECDRPGVFAVVGEEKVEVQTFSLLANTYAGMGVSFFILLLAIAHIVWKIEIHGGEVMRMNICVAIIVMQVVFLVGAHVKAEQTLCGFLAFLVYFCVMAEFCWLLLHALRIQGKIKKIFASNLNLEIVYVVIGWGLPLLMSVIAIGVQIDLKNPDDVCWKAAAGGAMWGYGAPVLLIALANAAVLVKLLIPTEELKAEYDHVEMRYRVLKDAIALMFFGVTCTLAYQVVDKAEFKQQYYFSGTVVLQAVCMFIFGREGRKDFVKREPKKEQQDEPSAEQDEKTTPDEKKPEEDAEEEDKDAKPKGRKKRSKPRHQTETMQVPTLKNLNIYMKDGQYVIEA